MQLHARRLERQELPSSKRRVENWRLLSLREKGPLESRAAASFIFLRKEIWPRQVEEEQLDFEPCSFLLFLNLLKKLILRHLHYQSSLTPVDPGVCVLGSGNGLVAMRRCLDQDKTTGL